MSRIHKLNFGKEYEDYLKSKRNRKLEDMSYEEVDAEVRRKVAYGVIKKLIPDLELPYETYMITWCYGEERTSNTKYSIAFGKGGKHEQN